VSDKLGVELVKGWICDSCEEISGEASGDPLYECGNCGSFLRSNSYADNHQCPECAKWGSKRGANGCPECEDGVQEECDVLHCQDCNEYFAIGESCPICEATQESEE
jgi:DNA-directed RNA polymerase subunit RPC12/RpoP